VTLLARRLSSRGVILCYHNVVPTNAAGAWDQLGLHMPVAAFERQMQWLRKHYTVVPLDEFAARFARHASLRGLAAVTFDDGYNGVFEHAWPVLRDLGIPATAFILGAAPEAGDAFWWDDPAVLRAYSPERRQTWLTALAGDSTLIAQSITPARRPRGPSLCRKAGWPQIAEAARAGLRLGAHSMTHRSLPLLDDVELQREVSECRDRIVTATGVTPEFFAYPYGNWDKRVRAAIRGAGYRGAVTLEFDAHAPPIDVWSLPRVSIPAGIRDSAFQAWSAGLNLSRSRSA
jgi:peptidoglycan/xylan/chitin deacetylase (PgdA/CDA1 family)